MSKLLLRAASRVVGAMAMLCLAGCIEQSVVVKVNEDGSGIVHERVHSSLLFKDKEKKIIPSEADIAARAKQLGDGVTLKLSKVTANRAGWRGYELIWSFDEIGSVNASLASIADEQLSKAPETPKKDLGYSFSMTDGVLTITNESKYPDEFDRPESIDDAGLQEGAVDPFADAPVPEATVFDVPLTSGFGMVQDKVASALLKGARIGIFVEIDGEVASTDARHQKNNLITLVNIDLGTFGENMAKFSQQTSQAKTLSDVQDLVDSWEGIDVDLKKTISVKFK